MTPETKMPVRVLEIRAADNGWVITAIERECSPCDDRQVGVYKSMVAESSEQASKICLQLMKAETWEKAVMIPPARRKRS